MNFICKLNHKKIALFINNYNKIISNNNDITYNDRENKVDNKKIVTIIACHTNSIVKYNTLINNIPHLLYPNNDIIIINTCDARYSNKIKIDIQKDEYPYKKNIIKYLEIPNDKYVDFGKFLYGLDIINQDDKLKYDFVIFVNDSIIINKPITYFYNLVIKNSKELYAYNDSSEHKYHYQSYLFAIRYDVIHKLIDYFNQNKVHIHNNNSVIQLIELKLNEIYCNDNDCFLKIAKLPNNIGKNIHFHNNKLYKLLFTSGILPFIKLKTLQRV
jgi:hypothetical protein